MMRRRFSGRRRRSTGAWIYPMLLVFLTIGSFTAVNTDDPSPAELHHNEQCEPLVWHDGMDAEGWQMLLEQGYRGRPDDGQEALYPPGCEGVQ